MLLFNCSIQFRLTLRHLNCDYKQKNDLQYKSSWVVIGIIFFTRWDAIDDEMEETYD